MLLEAVHECLPPDLRGPATTITPIAAGLSSAGVFRVATAGRAFVLKVAGETETRDDWNATLPIQRLAAARGLAPSIVHVDEARRAVVSVLVADRSFPAFYLTPATHDAAVDQLGDIVRRIHALPTPAGARPRDPHQFLVQLWAELDGVFSVPGFARDAIQRVLAGARAAGEAPLVVSHNDLNPSNLIYDGETIRVLDWAAAGLLDPFFDLATLAVFLRMDDATCRRLLSAHASTPVATLPRAFTERRRMVAGLAGTKMLQLAHRMNHAGATGAETLTSTLSLGDFYRQMRAGAVKVGTADGQWMFGLALLRESLAL